MHKQRRYRLMGSEYTETRLRKEQGHVVNDMWKEIDHSLISGPDARVGNSIAVMFHDRAYQLKRIQ